MNETCDIIWACSDVVVIVPVVKNCKSITGLG